MNTGNNSGKTSIIFTMCKYVYDIELQKYFLTLGSLKLQVLPWSDGNFNIIIFIFKIRNVIHVLFINFLIL